MPFLSLSAMRQAHKNHHRSENMPHPAKAPTGLMGGLVPILCLFPSCSFLHQTNVFAACLGREAGYSALLRFLCSCSQDVRIRQSNTQLPSCLQMERRFVFCVHLKELASIQQVREIFGFHFTKVLLLS